MAPRPTNLATTKAKLMEEATIQHFQEILPSAIGNHARDIAKGYLKNVAAMVVSDASLRECTPASIIKSAGDAASMDLPIDKRGLAYLVPFKKQATLIPGYLGLMEMAYRSGKVKSFAAHCIYESEIDSVSIKRLNGRYEVEHPFSFKPTSGKVVAVYATAEVDGIGPITSVMRIDEVEKIRKRSACPNSPAWKNDTEAMYKKTVIKQLCKFLPKSITSEIDKAMQYERETFDDAKTRTQDEIKAKAGRKPVDSTVVDPEPEQEQEEQQQEREPGEDDNLDWDGPTE